MKIDWTKAPAWANYFTINEFGQAVWFENQPTLRDSGRFANMTKGEGKASPVNERCSQTILIKR